MKLKTKTKRTVLCLLCLLLCATLVRCVVELAENSIYSGVYTLVSDDPADESNLLSADKAVERIKSWWGNIVYRRRTVTGVSASALEADSEKEYPLLTEDWQISRFLSACDNLSLARLTYVGEEIPQEGTLFSFRYQNESSTGNSLSFSVIENETYMILQTDGATYTARVSCNDDFRDGTIGVFEDYMYYLECRLTEEEVIAHTKALWNSIVVDRTQEVSYINLVLSKYNDELSGGNTSEREHIEKFLDFCSELQLDELTYDKGVDSYRDPSGYPLTGFYPNKELSIIHMASSSAFLWDDHTFASNYDRYCFILEGQYYDAYRNNLDPRKEGYPQERLSISIDDGDVVLVLWSGHLPYATRVPCDEEFAQTISNFFDFKWLRK